MPGKKYSEDDDNMLVSVHIAWITQDVLGGGPNSPEDDTFKKLFDPTNHPAKVSVANICTGLADKNVKTSMSQLHVGHLIWLYYFERMGLFRMLGRLLDDYATNGNFAISDSPNMKIALEVLTQLTKSGQSSTSRDRTSTYLRSLGWDLEPPITGIHCMQNKAFADCFTKFLQAALAYYAERRAISAIQNQSVTSSNMATLQVVKDAMLSLRNATKSFEYGRNRFNTFNGLLWLLLALGTVRQLRNDLGIPSSLTEPEQYITSAYEVLVEGKPPKPSESSRYSTHFQCAKYGFDIMAAIVSDMTGASDDSIINPPANSNPNATLENAIEGYRSAYYRLTNIDLAPPRERKTS